MTIKELKELAPEAEVFSLTDDAKYLIVISKGQVSLDAYRGLLDNLHRQRIKATILAVSGDVSSTLKILELST